MRSYPTFVVPYDFSEPSREALCAAQQLASQLGASVHLLHVIELPALVVGGFSGAPVAPPIPLAQMRERAFAALRQAADELEGPDSRIEPHVVEGGGVAEKISETASELDADLIVMGTHGRTGLAHVLMGSVAERTLRCAPCPVLTVRAAA